MSHGIGPQSAVRHSLRTSSSKTATCALLLLFSAVVLLSLITNTQRLKQHAAVSIRPHFYDSLADGSTGAHSTAHHKQLALTKDLTPAVNSSSIIPRIIHQNYLSGRQQLLSDALKPLSHFRKEWWMSCQTHHRAWQHMLWDAERCELLLRERYPWFLDTWAALGDSTVLKSDAIRPFILHAYGGVYLDLDSECFTDMTPWLSGAQLVLQAEVGHTINNAQMASAPGHPLWSLFQKAIQARVAAGKRWPLETTGPHLLTDVVRKLTNNTKRDLPGPYILPDGSRLAVYGPRQWFTPCAWNDWTCAVKVAHDRPLMTAAGLAAVATATAAARATSAAAAAASRVVGTSADTATTGGTISGAAAAAAAAFPVMLGAPGVAGVHHFSGSWLGLDGSKSLSLRKEGVSGVLSFLYNGSGFVQNPCKDLRLLPTSPPANTPASVVESSLAVPVCWKVLTAAVQAGNCTVLSIRSQPLPAAEPCSSSRSDNSVTATASTSTSINTNTTSNTNASSSSCGRAGGLPKAGFKASAGHNHHPEQQQQQQQQQDSQGMRLQQWLAAELSLAAAGCQVKLVTDTAVDLDTIINTGQQQELPVPAALKTTSTDVRSHLSSSRSRESSSSSSSSSSAGLQLAPVTKAVLSRISTVTALLGVSADPFAEPPVHTLDSLLAAEMGQARATLLLLDLTPSVLAASHQHHHHHHHHYPACATTLDVFNQLYLSSSSALQQVDSLVLTLPLPQSLSASSDKPGLTRAHDDAAVSSSSAHKAFAAYQHLFQESGFVGYYHSQQATKAEAAAGLPVVLGVHKIHPA